jgi:nucleotide-binding universal stress UspA family protein
MTTLSKPSASRFTNPRRAPMPATPMHVPQTTRRVLVATDGNTPANAALRLARLYTQRGEWSPDVITVCEPVPSYVGDMGIPLAAPDQETLVRNGVIGRISKQLRGYGLPTWKISVEFGRTPASIVRAAAERNAELIVVGLGKHGLIPRLFGAETAARVARQAGVPVLAVHPRARRLPDVAVVGIDFSESSVQAAREALALLGTRGRLHLVHVKWGVNATTLTDADWERAYTVGADLGFSRVMQRLGTRPGIQITSELVQGPLVSGLLRAAKAAGAHVIALGRHSQTIIDRMVIGSTPSQVLRAARCSVLIAPAVAGEA